MKNFTFCILMLYGFAAQAQLIVSNTVETPAQLVQNVLVDASVTPTNIKFNGSAANANLIRDQAGHFTTNFNPTNLGLSAGVILATGNAKVALGPNDDPSKSIFPATPILGDSDLALLSGSNINNSAVLEFDFVATGLELNFDYVFASEEYPEYSTSAFNDVFGFFLSGPGLSGPYSNNSTNIALLPTTTTGTSTVSIFNVNNGSANNGPCRNCQYYVTNGTGATPLANPSIQYDGFTTVLRATAALQCGETYHMKLATANAGSDNAYDSAVFLRNFKVKPIVLTANDSDVPICQGLPIDIESGIVNPPSGAFDYEWTYGVGAAAVPVGTNSPELHLPAGSPAGVYTLTYYTPVVPANPPLPAGGHCKLGEASITVSYVVDPLVDPAPITVCTPLPPPYDLNDIDPTAEILNGAPAFNYDIHYYYTQAEAEAPVPTAGIPISVLNDFQLTTNSATIWGRFEDQVATGCIFIKPLVINYGTAPSGTFSYPGPFCYNPSASPVLPTTTVTPGGTYNTSSAGLIVNPTTGQLDLAASSAGNYTVNYHLNAAGTCPAFDVTGIPVVISTAPVAPIVTSPVVYCQGETASALSATGTNLLWYTTATGGTGSMVAPTPTTVTPGNTDYYVSQSNGCEGGRSLITVNVNAIPAAPTFTAVAPYCQNASALPLTASGTNLLWYSTATGGVGNSVAPTPSTLNGGTINYYVSQTVSNCESPRASIGVTTTALPAAPTVTSPIGYCQNDVPAALTATGSNLLWYAAATGGVGNATAPIINTAGVSSNTYYVSQTVSGCEGPRAAITVNVTTVPAAPGVTSPLTYCQNATAPILSAPGTNLLWYSAATGGVGNATAPTPSTTASGSTTYYVSQTSGSCEGPRATIVVDITPTPAVPGVAPLSYCQNAPSAVLTATGSNLLWYTAATGGTGNAVAPTPVTTAPGITTYYVTQTVNTCESPRAALAVTVIAPPAAPVTAPVAYCQNDIPLALTAVGSNLLWYAAATGSVGNAAAPSVNTATVGNTTYYVSQTVNGCEGPRASLTVSVSAVPVTPTVASPLTYCQNETAAVLTAVGSNLLWYASATGGIGSVSAPIPSTISSGSTTYYVSQTSGVCEGPRAAIIVNVTPTPPTPGVAPLSYCQNIPAAVLTATGSNLLWYATATGGTGTAVAPTPTTNTAGTATYYVTQTVNACESPRAALVVTTIAPPAAPGVSSPVQYCSGVTSVALTATGSNLLWYATATGGVGNAIAPAPGTATVGSTIYYVSQTVSGCEGPRAAITVNITAIPAAPSVTTPLTYCQNVTATALSAVGSNLLWYASASGGTGNTAAPIPNTTIAGTTTYYVSQTVACEGPRAAIVVNVTPTPALPGTAPITYCQNDPAPALTATGSNLLWYAAATGGTGTTVAPTPITSSGATTTYYVTQTVNGCESPRAALLITVNPLPAIPTGTITQPNCITPTGTIILVTGVNLQYSINGGTTYQPSEVFAGLAPNATYTFIVRNTLTGCVSAASSPFNIVAAPTFPTAPAVSPVYYCQDDAVSALTATGSNLLWYTSATGGTGNTAAPIPDTATAGSTTYYVSQTVGCEGPRAAIVVSVGATPLPVLAQDGIICFDIQTNTGTAYTLFANLSDTDYDFEWFVDNSGTFDLIPLQTQSTYSVTVPGTYGVRATNVFTGCVSDIITAPVGMTSPPLKVEAIPSEYFADLQTIAVTVTPPGIYEYQLDNGAWQASNVFVDVLSGSRTINVRNACGSKSTDAYLINYPKFFTPNGDGYNDTWNIFALKDQDNAKIYIFDRYGKLLKEISPSGKGWDGSFNSQGLPSTDYWFIVHYEENKISKVFKSHFALKR